MIKKQPAVFLDRDGVLNEDIGYPHLKKDLKVVINGPETMAELVKRGYLLVVITNQSGVARGKFSLDQVDIFNSLLAESYREKAGVEFAEFFICPHHAGGTVPEYSLRCECRKPLPGMIYTAAKRWNIELERSYLIGDRSSDIQAGNTAGLKTVQVLGKYPLDQNSFAVVPNILDSLEVIRPCQQFMD